DCKMQESFSGRPARTFEYVAGLVDQKDVFGSENALVDAARGNRKLQRFAGDDRAEVAAGSKHPAARIETSPNSYKFVSKLGGLFNRHSRKSQPTTTDGPMPSITTRRRVSRPPKRLTASRISMPAKRPSLT